jgi:hypothetical protein
LNPVRAKSSGLVPLRRGRRIDVTPGHMDVSVQMGTMKEREPRSSPSTMRRATTIAIFGMPKEGVVAGIYLRLC